MGHIFQNPLQNCVFSPVIRMAAIHRSDSAIFRSPWSAVLESQPNWG